MNTRQFLVLYLNIYSVLGFGFHLGACLLVLITTAGNRYFYLIVWTPPYLQPVVNYRLYNGLGTGVCIGCITCVKHQESFSGPEEKNL